MLTYIWNEIFFRPLLNLLIGLYNTIGLENLGLAIIWLTVVTRLILLPLSFKAKSQQRKQAEMKKELRKLQESYGNNPAVLRQEQRELLNTYKFRRWPKIISLGVQGFVLLILYQVFVGGVKLGEIVDLLYGFIDVPVMVNTIFLGMDIAEKNFVLSLVPALILAFTIVIEHGGIRVKWTRNDLLLLVGFPLATFGFLIYLPAVKAMFVLSSLLFSLGFMFLTNFFESIAHQEKLMAENKAKKASMEGHGIPHPRDRFK